MNNIDEKTKNTLINNWFYNCYNNRNNNDVVLILDFSYTRKDTFERNRFTIIDCDVPLITIEKKKNTILNNYNIEVLEKLSNLGCSFILCEEKKIFDFIPKDLKLEEVDVSEEERYHYYIEKFNPLEFLNYSDNDEIISYILNIFNITKDDSITINRKRLINTFLITEQSTYGDKYLYQELENDIYLYKEYKLLTARLSMIMYRIAFISPFASASTSGRYFREKIGTKSFTINIKSKNTINRYFIRDNSIKMPEYNVYQKSLKVYDLNISQETHIRREIASNILTTSLFDKDFNTIAKVTGLTIDEVKKLVESVKITV